MEQLPNQMEKIYIGPNSSQFVTCNHGGLLETTLSYPCTVAAVYVAKYGAYLGNFTYSNNFLPASPTTNISMKNIAFDNMLGDIESNVMEHEEMAVSVFGSVAGLRTDGRNTDPALENFMYIYEALQDFKPKSITWNFVGNDHMLTYLLDPKTGDISISA